jgi:integrase
MRLHDLRHSCSTFLAALGVDLKTAMEILGHTNAQMTLHYTHALDERKQQAMERIGKRFGTKDEAV